MDALAPCGSNVVRLEQGANCAEKNFSCHVRLPMMRAGWPGGPADRLDLIALAWVSRWRPIAPGATLPV